MSETLETLCDVIAELTSGADVKQAIAELGTGADLKQAIAELGAGADLKQAIAELGAAPRRPRRPRRSAWLPAASSSGASSARTRWRRPSWPTSPWSKATAWSPGGRTAAVWPTAGCPTTRTWITASSRARTSISI